MSEYLLVITTVPDRPAAERIARTLIEERLAACVSQSPSCRSSFWWKGEVKVESEYMLFIKTRNARYTELEKKLVAAHPYDVPEVIAIPITRGYGKYLNWMKEETSPETGGVSK